MYGNFSKWTQFAVYGIGGIIQTSVDMYCMFGIFELVTICTMPQDIILKHTVCMELAEPKQVWKSTVCTVFVIFLDGHNLQHMLLVQSRHADIG